MSLPQVLQYTLTGTGDAEHLPNVPFLNQFIGVTVYFSGNNSGTIYLGNSAATANAVDGFGGDAFTAVVIPISNTNQLWASGNTGDVVSFIGA